MEWKDDFFFMKIEKGCARNYVRSPTCIWEEQLHFHFARSSVEAAPSAARRINRPTRDLFILIAMDFAPTQRVERNSDAYCVDEMADYAPRAERTNRANVGHERFVTGQMNAT
jgi:hypothetical protein